MFFIVKVKNLVNNLKQHLQLIKLIMKVRKKTRIALKQDIDFLLINLHKATKREKLFK